MPLPLDTDRYAPDAGDSPDDSPLDEWTLDDLERSADLASARSAWEHADAMAD